MAEPVRVRAGWVDDDEIRRVADVYRAPLAGDVVDLGADGWTPDLDWLDEQAA
jgi:S-DNA-T family DNA segregation ATPase FtsK/SpoIIIE